MNIVNFRDLGGISTRYGTIKEHKLLRSGELVNLHPSDVDTLVNQYQLRLILDFRDQNEIGKRPDMEIPGARYCNIDIMKEVEENKTSLDHVAADLNPQTADEGMRDIYRTIILNSHAGKSYHDFVSQLIRLEEGAALFHCFAGKDRTGIGAAIVLTMLGVHKDDIMADYLLTNEMRQEENDRLIEQARLTGLSELQLQGLRHLYSVDESYLEEMYRTIDEVYGCFDHYLGTGLSITAKEIELLRTGYTC